VETTTTGVEVTTAINEQTSPFDSELTTVTDEDEEDEITTVTDSQTQTGS